MTRSLHLPATLAIVCAGLLAVPASQAASVVVDVAGAQSVNLQGEAGNTVWLVDIGTHSAIDSLGWSVSLEAFAPSTLAEMQVGFGSSSGLDVVSFAPGSADGVSGLGSYTGRLDLTGLGLAVGADGLLRIEFSESYKDFALGAVEGRWLSGSLTFDVTPVPEPVTAALLLLGLGVVGARVRRSAGTPRE